MKSSIAVHDEFLFAESALEVVLVEMCFLVVQEWRDELVSLSTDLRKGKFRTNRDFCKIN